MSAVSRAVAIAISVALGVAVGGGVGLHHRGLLPRRAATVYADALSLAESPAAPTRRPVSPPTLPDYDEWSFGGQPIAWWSESLRSVSPADPAASLLTARIIGNGLAISEAGGLRTVEIGAELQRWLLGDRPDRNDAVRAPCCDDMLFDVASVRLGAGRPRLITARRSTTRATLRVAFHGGAYDDGPRPGLTRLAQLAMLESDGVARSLESRAFAAAADFDVATGAVESAFTLTADEADFEGLAEVVIRATLGGAARIDEAGLARAKVRIGLEDNRPPNVWEPLLVEAAGDGYLTNDPAGDSDVLDTISLDEVTAHGSRILAPGNATVVATGAFSEARIRGLLAGVAGGSQWIRSEEPKILPGTHFALYPGEVRLVAHRSSGADARDLASRSLLSAILDERLQATLRAGGVGYTSTVEIVRSTFLDGILVAFPAADMGTAMAVFDTVLADLRRGSIEKRELDRNRAYVLAKLRWMDRAPAVLADNLGSGLTGPQFPSRDIVEETYALRASDLTEWARRWLTPSEAVQVQLSPRPPPPEPEP
jgi:predicted Zn-dependent peptidase